MSKDVRSTVANRKEEAVVGIDDQLLDLIRHIYKDAEIDGDDLGFWVDGWTVHMDVKALRDCNQFMEINAYWQDGGSLSIDGACLIENASPDLIAFRVFSFAEQLCECAKTFRSKESAERAFVDYTCALGLLGKLAF